MSINQGETLYTMNIELALDKQFAVNYITPDLYILNPRKFRHCLCEACSDTWLYLRKEGLI